MSLWNVSCPNDPDPVMLREAAATGAIVTFEDHLCATGLASTVARGLLVNGLHARFACHGLGGYAPSGDFNEVYDVVGLSPEALAQTVSRLASS